MSIHFCPGCDRTFLTLAAYTEHQKTCELYKQAYERKQARRIHTVFERRRA